MFILLKKKIQDKFATMTVGNQTLFDVKPDKDHIWDLYLAGFSDPTIRQSNNCNCCKSFLRQWAGIVTIMNNKLVSIWHIEDVPEEYANSIRLVRDYIDGLAIKDVFLNNFPKLGTDQNSQLLESGNIIQWNHFFLHLPKEYVHKGSTSVESVQGEKRDNKNVLQRSLNELGIDSTETVLELIAQGSLYKGNEFRETLTRFLAIQVAYKSIPENEKDNFCWLMSTVKNVPTRIRNSAIGTLLIDIEEGVKDLDNAVKAYEFVVAGPNYQRPKTLATPKMREQAKQKIAERGYGDSLFRRFARVEDLNVNNLLFTSTHDVVVSTDPFDVLAKGDVVDVKKLSKVEEIQIDTFLKNILPKAKTVEVLLENHHLPNFCSLVTAQIPSAKIMFKWDNPFCVVYTGGMADSNIIKERVKAAGGNVVGERVSLSWHNHDDLDLHVTEPDGNKIYYRSRVSYKSGGQLDVDMNAGSGKTRTPVENTVWTNRSKMLEGKYVVEVNNFCARETNDVGFEVQIEFDGNVMDFVHPTSPRNGATTQVVTFNYSHKNGFTFDTDVKAKVVQREKYGLKTQQFHKVNSIMLSPNHWNEAIGGKHFLFMLENCVADESVRPFFPEYLVRELYEDRKTFEMLGDVLKIEPNPNQLSGLGFSDTQRNNITVRVTSDNLKRLLKVNF